jgi:hypothetical protein
MWLEEEFPYYEIKLDCDSYDKTKYNDIVQNAIIEWQQKLINHFILYAIYVAAQSVTSS